MFKFITSLYHRSRQRAIHQQTSTDTSADTKSAKTTRLDTVKKYLAESKDQLQHLQYEKKSI